MPLSSTSFSIRQNQVRLAAAEDLGEHRAEILADFFKRFGEHLPRLHVDAVDDFQQLRLGLNQIVVLLGQKLITLLGFLVFLDGHEIHRADFVEPLLQGLNLLRDGVPIRGRACGGHFFRRHHMHLRRAFVGERDGDAFAANVVEGEVIFLLDPFAQVLDGHVFLRQFNIQGAALFLQLSQLSPLPAQVFFARNDIALPAIVSAPAIRRFARSPARARAANARFATANPEFPTPPALCGQ